MIGVAYEPLDRHQTEPAAELEAWQLAVAAHEAMLATMQEGIVLFDGAGDGAVRYANPAASALLGGRLLHADDLEPPPLRGAVVGVLHGEARREVTFEVLGRAIEAVVTETGLPRSVLLVARDVTAARRTDQLRRNFVANASHELKTPVASILGLASALERAAADPQATRRFVGMLGREAERLSMLVSDLLDLSRLESDVGPMRPVLLDHALLEQCEKLRGDAADAGVRLHVEPLESVEVMGCASDLSQMVHNLLSNAIRYTGAGGEVRVSLHREAASARVTVADTGIGIPAADLDRVFERFYRVGMARDRETGGTGLGLAIVRHVAETHGGEVGVTSEVGTGSAFTVTLPLPVEASETVTAMAPMAGDEGPRSFALNRTRADRAFRLLCLAAGMTTLVILVLIGGFLLSRSMPALRAGGWSFFTTQELPPNPIAGQPFGIAALIFGTVEISLIALVIATPVAIATALFISEYAPRRLRRPLTSIVELLAAVPSLIYGLWGFFFLQPRMTGVSEWLNDHLSFIPIFRVDFALFKSSPFIAGVVLALMIVPIATAIMREVFSQAPPSEKEGALALGATRWGMVKAVVLPFGRGGMIGGAMLGLGRALGETIAVAVILSTSFVITPNLLQSGGNTIPATIVLRFSESSGLALSVLMAAGLTLFALTLVVNMLASLVVARSRSGAGVEI